LSEFGVYVQDWATNTAFTATIAADGGSPCATCTFTSSNGNAIWVGIGDSTGPGITSVTIDVTDGGVDDHYFAIGPVALQEGGTHTNDNPTPEPASILLMAGGVAALAWKARQGCRG
jgi:hypothetical protein